MARGQLGVQRSQVEARSDHGAWPAGRPRAGAWSSGGVARRGSRAGAWSEAWLAWLALTRGRGRRGVLRRGRGWWGRGRGACGGVAGGASSSGGVAGGAVEALRYAPPARGRGRVCPGGSGVAAERSVLLVRRGPAGD